MIAAVNILQNKFGGSKNLPTFVMPRNVKDTKSTRYISNRLNKAGFLSDNSTSVVLRFLAETEWRLASFLHTYHKFLVRTMPRNDKNLSQTHEVCSVSTSAPRQRATTVRKSRTVKSPATDVKRPITPLYQITMNLVVSYSEMTGRVRTCSVIHTDIYQATNENEALGLALSTVRAKYGHYHYIDLQSVKRERTYHINNL